MSELPRAVSIREVGPRDGFQNEPEVIPTERKIELIDALARTGLRRLEVTSFVRADVIPQLADAAEVLAGIDVPREVSVSVLIPNERGLDAALELRERIEHAPAGAAVGGGREAGAGGGRTAFDEINVFMSASRQVREFFGTAREHLGEGVQLTAHFHNTRGQGLANVLAALEAGVESFESSFGELGGCPVPAGATGNIASEDLVSMLHEMGIATGIDLDALLVCARRVQEILGRPLGSHTLVAGPVEWRE